MKTGVIPPVLAVPEIVFHGPHFFFGGFGITTGGGMGNGGRRLTMGVEGAYEFHPPDLSTPYLSAAYFRYETGVDAAGFAERSDCFALTAGYEWKVKHAELQLGAGALLILTDDRTGPPCSGLGCVDFRLPLPCCCRRSTWQPDSASDADRSRRRPRHAILRTSAST